MEAMEAWPHADERVMQRSYNEQVCISCAWFTYGLDGRCHTVVRCALQEAQLQQGQHLTHCCRNWKAVHHMETGPAAAAQPQPWVLILIMGAESTVVPTGFFTFPRRIFCDFSRQLDWRN